MNGITVPMLFTLAALGVDYGWQPSTDGQLEYIIQLEPAALESLKAGKDITSEIHPDARGVRRFRIHAGTGPLPRVGVLAANTSPTRLSTSDAAGSAGTLSDDLHTAATQVGGVLNLPPPPSVTGPDGKASILVRPGDRALPGAMGPTASVPATPAIPNYEPSTPATTATDPQNIPIQPPAAGGGWPTSQPPVSVPGSGIGLPNRGSVFPVPSSGPETGLPEPIRGAGIRRPGDQANDQLADNDGKGREVTASDLLTQLAASRSEAAANKPAIAEEDAIPLSEQKLQELAEKRARELQAEHPWAPLVLTSLALFGSLAANLYLGWIATGVYRRYRDMCDELHDIQASLT